MILPKKYLAMFFGPVYSLQLKQAQDWYESIKCKLPVNPLCILVPILLIGRMVTSESQVLVIATIMTMLHLEAHESQDYSRKALVFGSSLLLTTLSETFVYEDQNLTLMNLATYMVLVTTLAWLGTIWQQLKMNVSALMQSQTTVNKIADSIFREQTTEVGFAILHRRERNPAQSENDLEQLVLLRYNAAFKDMIDLSTQSCQDQDDRSDNMNVPDDFSNQKEALSNTFLSKLKLMETVNNSNDQFDGPESSQNPKKTLASLFLSLANKRGESGENTSDEMIVNELFTTQVNSQKPQSGMIKHQTFLSEEQVFRVSVTELCVSSQLYLVKTQRLQGDGTPHFLVKNQMLQPETELRDIRSLSVKTGSKLRKKVEFEPSVNEQSPTALTIQKHITEQSNEAINLTELATIHSCPSSEQDQEHSEQSAANSIVEHESIQSNTNNPIVIQSLPGGVAQSSSLELSNQEASLASDSLLTQTYQSKEESKFISNPPSSEEEEEKVVHQDHFQNQSPAKVDQNTPTVIRSYKRKKTPKRNFESMKHLSHPNLEVEFVDQNQSQHTEETQHLAIANKNIEIVYNYNDDSDKDKHDQDFFDVKHGVVGHNLTDVMQNPDLSSNALLESQALNSSLNSIMDDSNLMSQGKTHSFQESDLLIREQSKDLITESMVLQNAQKDFLKIDTSQTGSNQKSEPKSAYGTDWQRFAKQGTIKDRRSSGQSASNSYQLDRGNTQVYKRSTTKRSDFAQRRRKKFSNKSLTTETFGEKEKFRRNATRKQSNKFFDDIVNKKLSQMQNLEVPDLDNAIILDTDILAMSYKKQSTRSSHKSAAAALKNNQIFVYKIIHDLRHPTEALAHGLDTVLLQVKNKKFSQRRSSIIEGSSSCVKIEGSLARLKELTQKINEQPSVRRRPKRNLSMPARNTFEKNHQAKKNYKETPTTHLSSIPSLRGKSEGETTKQSAQQQKKPRDLEEDLRLLRTQFANIPIEQIQIRKSKKRLNISYEEDEQRIDSSSESFQSKSSKVKIKKKFSTQSMKSLQSAAAQQSLKKFSSSESVDPMNLVSLRASKNPRKTMPLGRSRLASAHSMTPKAFRGNGIESMTHTYKKKGQTSSRDDTQDNAIVQVLDNIYAESNNILSSDSNEVSNSHKKSTGQYLALPQNETKALKKPKGQQRLSILVQDVDEQKRSRGSGNNRGQTLTNKMARDIRSLIVDRQQLAESVELMTKSRQEIKTWLQNMQGQTQMMLTLLRDLMNQAQLANNTFTMVDSYFSLKTLVRKCISVTESHSSMKKVRVEGPEFLNPLDKYYFKQVFSDERRYAQIILNFLSNGIKFTPANGVVKIILKVQNIQEVVNEPLPSVTSKLSNVMSNNSNSVSLHSGSDKQLNHGGEADEQTGKMSSKQSAVTTGNYEEKLVNFDMIFSDSGCGISPENQQKLFNNFSKLKETQDANKAGVGLGLCICKEIIHAYGGSIDIQSSVGQGTDFIIKMQAKCKVDIDALENAKHKIEQFGYDSSSGVSQNNSATQSLQEQSNSSEETSSDDYGEYDIGLSKVDESIDEMSSHSGENNRSESSGWEQAQQQYESHCDPNALQIVSLHKNQEEYKDHQQLQQQLPPSVLVVQQQAISNNVCLLANDNPFLLMAFQYTLQEHFDVVETCENGQEAVDAVKAQNIDFYQAIVLDIQMPVMDGLEACILIMKHFKESSKSGLARSPARGRQQLGDSFYDSHASLSEVSGDEFELPAVYALTSEEDPNVINQIREAGFKQIFNELNQENISIIMQGCEQRKLNREQQINQVNQENQYANLGPPVLCLSSQQSQTEELSVSCSSREDHEHDHADNSDKEI